MRVPQSGCGCAGCGTALAALAVLGFLGTLSNRISEASAGHEVVLALVAVAAGAAALYVVHWRRQQAAKALSLERQRHEAQANAHYEGLVYSFGPENAARIVRRELWAGASEAMVVAMLGAPADVSERVFKTKTSRTLKYQPIGKGRFSLKVHLENDCVVGWDR